MKTPALLALAACLSFSAAASAEHTGNGKALHDKACTGCHDTSVYTRPDRTIKSAQALDQRVRMCESAAAQDWSGEQLADVIHYLDKTFYKFSK